MQTTIDLVQSPIVLVTVLVIGLICETLRRLIHAKAGDPGLRGVFFVLSSGRTPDSQGILPLLIAAPLGFVPWLPPAECLVKPGYETAARFGTYLFAGVVCAVAYDKVMGTVMNAVRHVSARQSAPPEQSSQ